MTIDELIEKLQDAKGELELNGYDGDPGNVEVRLAHQPNWPFEYSIDQVVAPDVPKIVTRAEFDEMSEDDQERCMSEEDEGYVVLIDEGQEVPETIVYIGEGRQVGYLPSAASRSLGWR